MGKKKREASAILSVAPPRRVIVRVEGIDFPRTMTLMHGDSLTVKLPVVFTAGDKTIDMETDVDVIITVEDIS